MNDPRSPIDFAKTKTRIRCVSLGSCKILRVCYFSDLRMKMAKGWADKTNRIRTSEYQTDLQSSSLPCLRRHHLCHTLRLLSVDALTIV